MNRRDFLQHAGAASAGLVLAKPLLTKPADDWRRFEVMTRVEVLKPVGATRVWVPAALVQQTPYQQTLANTFNAPDAKARLVERTDDALGLVAAEFPAGGILKVSLIEKKGCYRVMEHRKQVLRYARVTRASLRMTCLALLSVKKRERRAGGTTKGRSDQEFSMTSAADYHSCGLSVDGAVYCWGGNHDGQLGTGDDKGKNEATHLLAATP